MWLNYKLLFNFFFFFFSQNTVRKVAIMYMMRTYMPKACLKLLGKKQDSTISRFSC